MEPEKRPDRCPHCGRRPDEQSTHFFPAALPAQPLWSVSYGVGRPEK